MVYGLVAGLCVVATFALWRHTRAQDAELGRLAALHAEGQTRIEGLQVEREALSQELSSRTQSLGNQATALQDALEKLSRTQDDLVKTEKLASMGRLVAGIAHEINNPMNAVINTLTPLQETVSSLATSVDPVAVAAAKDAADMLDVVKRGALRAHAIVQSLNNYSRGDNETMREVNVLRSIDDTIDLLQPRLRGIEIEKDIQTGIRISGFAGQIDHVLLNLLTNAVQAIGDKPGRIRVGMHSLERGQEVMLTVSDTGTGIAADVLPHIFDPFFTTKAVGQGAGLGLCIVHGIVERHGGRIEVQSVAGQGATFRVFLPVFAGFIAATRPSSPVA